MSEHRTVHTSIKYNSTFTSTIIRDTWLEHKILAGTCPPTYRYFAQYCDGPKASFFNVAQAALPVMRSAADLNLREIGAMCNIMYCFSALELSDVYGPFPWTDYKNDVQEPPVTYEPMDQIYDSLFVNLKDAGKILKEFTSTSEEHQDTINQILAQYDKICGDVKTWEQFSNSIRLAHGHAYVQRQSR